MRFEIKYTKTGNQFFFISNLSEWHFSCRPEYNKLWLQQTGPLSAEEKKALLSFKKIIKKYSFGPKYLGYCFFDYSEKTIWSCVENFVTKEEFETLKEIFKIFLPRFKLIWNKNKLDKIAKEIKTIYKDKKFKKAIGSIETLFNTKINKFTLFLLLVPENSFTIGGGANTQKGIVTVEIRNKKDSNEAILIGLHEIIHQHFNEINSKLNISNKIVKKQLLKIPLFKEEGFSCGLKELIICSLVPDGFLRGYFEKNYRPINKRKINLLDRSDLEDFIIYKSYPLIKEYIKKRKKLDQHYVNCILSYTLEFIKKALSSACRT